MLQKLTDPLYELRKKSPQHISSKYDFEVEATVASL